jgi:hypothetical protein
MARRDKIVAKFQSLIAQKGEKENFVLTREASSGTSGSCEDALSVDKHLDIAIRDPESY